MRKMRGSAGRRARKKEIGKWVRWWGRSSRGNKGGGKRKRRWRWGERKTSGGGGRRKTRCRFEEKEEEMEVGGEVLGRQRKEVEVH